ncbi:MAG: 50S ribosomal protein L9 [Kiritimatiellae bacterium]|jgi:large subunit ribosomal protein L9|nr:50S ribosomal protein L9 [Kiritimatiellia bacterium]
MSKEIILLKDVEHLGEAGDIVVVADGYARNYLFPKGYADVVSETTKRKLVKIQKINAIEKEADISTATVLLSQLAGVQCTIAVKVTEDDKMYGSVTEEDIISALNDLEIELPKNVLVLEEHIKELGVFDIAVKLHPEVLGSFKLWVVNEES